MRADTSGLAFNAPLTARRRVLSTLFKKHISQVSHLDVECGVRERGKIHAESKNVEYTEAYRLITYLVRYM